MIRPMIIPFGDKTKALMLSGQARNLFATVLDEAKRSGLSSLNRTFYDRESGAAIQIDIQTGVYGKSGYAMITVPFGVTKKEIRGFLTKDRWSAKDEERNPAHIEGNISGTKNLITTDNTGFIGLMPKVKYLAAKNNTWTGKNKFLTWDVRAVYLDGKLLDTDYYLPFINILAAAISKENKLVILTTQFHIKFFSLKKSLAENTNISLLSTDTFCLSDVTEILGNNQNDPCRPCFNNDATKLVFIGKNASVSANALPFDTTLVNDNLQVGINRVLLCEHEPTNANKIGITSNAAVDVNAHKLNWQAVYRVNIDTEIESCTIESATEQYAEHVWKMTLLNEFYYERVYTVVIPFVHTTDDIVNNGTGIATITSLYNEPYISYIWFDRKGIERTEIATSSMELDISATYTTNYHRDITADDIVEKSANFSRTINYTGNSTATSVLGVIDEFSVVIGGSESVSTFYQKNTDPPVISATSDNVETRTEKKTAVLTGLNKYIANIINIADQFDGDAEITTAGVDYDILGYNRQLVRGIDATTNPFQNANFDALSTDFVAVTGNVKRKYHSTAIYPSEIVDVVLGAFGVTSATYTTENFIFIKPKSVQSADNFTVNALTDVYGNYIYTFTNNMATPNEFWTQAYKKTVDKETQVVTYFVNVSDKVQANVAKEITEFNDLIGVV